MSRSQVTTEHTEQFHADDSRAASERCDIVDTVRDSVLGDNCTFNGPFGPRPVVYADHTASGRSLSFIERYVQEHVLPLYGNTHTTTSITGRQSTLFRQEAREIVHRCVNGGARDHVLFVGSGVTGAINKVVHLLGLRTPGALSLDSSAETVERWRRTHSVDAYSYHNLPVKPDPSDVAARGGTSASVSEQQAEAAAAVAVVFVGPWEHHSNLLPWRESLARVVQIGEDAAGGVDLAQLEQQLKVESAGAQKLLVGSFSAGSNVTGVLADVKAVTTLLHKYGALSFWDFAAAGPHVRIDLNPSGQGAADSIDGVFVSPHKFVGGPQCPGVLVLKRHIFDLCEPPEQPGGGTVLFVTEDEHRYLDSLEEREEAGTPAIVGAIRCGLVFQLQEAVGGQRMHALEQRAVARVFAAWNRHPLVEVLGPSVEVARLPIVSFMLRHQSAPGGRYLHYNFVCALLNDLFGVQARGGCACAGPYGQALLGIDSAASEKFEAQLVEAKEIVRPGFVRVSFPYFFNDAMVDYVVNAVLLVADHGWRMLNQYRFYHETGEWKHHADLKFKERRWLQSVSYKSGKLEVRQPRNGSAVPLTNPGMSAPEQAAQFTQLLETARKLLVSSGESGGVSVAREGRGLDPKSEELRWFALPSDGDFVKPLDASASQGDHSLSKPPTSVTEAAGLVGGSAAASAPPPPAAAAVAAAAASTAQPGAGKKKKGGGAVGAGGAPPNAKGQQKKITKKLLKLTGSAISDYSMIRDGDRILVGLSGGKDSLTLLNLLLALQKKAPVKFHLGVCTVDPMTEGFDPAPLKGYVRETLGLDYFFESQPIIAEAETHMQKDSICAYCSRMKRGILYTTARREKYNVLALGQHLDDLAESFVMSAFNNGRLRTMKAHYEIEAGDMRVIRPLSYVREHMTRQYAQLTTMPVIADNCPGCFSAPTERAHIKQLMAAEEERTPSVFQNLLKTIRPLMESDIGEQETAEMTAKRKRIELLTERHGGPGGGKAAALHGKAPAGEEAPAGKKQRGTTKGYQAAKGGFVAPSALLPSSLCTGTGVDAL